MWKFFVIVCAYSIEVKYKGGPDDLAPIKDSKLSPSWEYVHGSGQPWHPAPVRLTYHDSDTFIIETKAGETFIEGSVSRPGHELSPIHEIDHVDVFTTEFKVTYNCH